jgi:hypothetical protein
MVLDGRPCSACTEEIELEKEKKELEIRIKKIYIRRRALRTAMNENHDPFIHKFPPEIASHIFMQYSRPVNALTDPIGLARYTSVRMGNTTALVLVPDPRYISPSSSPIYPRMVGTALLVFP